MPQERKKPKMVKGRVVKLGSPGDNSLAGRKARTIREIREMVKSQEYSGPDSRKLIAR